MVDKFLFDQTNVVLHQAASLITESGQRIIYFYDDLEKRWVVKELPDVWGNIPIAKRGEIRRQDTPLKVCYYCKDLASYLNGLGTAIEQSNYHKPDIMQGFRRWH